MVGKVYTLQKEEGVGVRREERIESVRKGQHFDNFAVQSRE